MPRSQGSITLPVAVTLPHAEVGLEVDSSSAFLIVSCTLGMRLPATEEEGESQALPKLVRDHLPPKGIQRLVHVRQKPGAKTQACEISGERDMGAIREGCLKEGAERRRT